MLFLVETSNAGPGNLEVTVNNGQVPTSAQAHGLHTYAISFTPKEAKPHEIELKFNGENVPGILTQRVQRYATGNTTFFVFFRESFRLPSNRFAPDKGVRRGLGEDSCQSAGGFSYRRAGPAEHH